MGAVAADLASEFDVHCLKGFGAVIRYDFSDAALVCIVERKKNGGNEEFTQLVLNHFLTLGLPVLIMSENFPPMRRVKLLESGVAELLSDDLGRAELLLRFRRCIASQQQNGQIVELQGKLDRLSQYFSEDVVKMIMSQKSLHHDYGENLEATIFFLDIRNFTTISESLEPNLVAALLNRLYTDIMDLILTFKGSVNKIIGDALLATFGCPVRGEHDAQNAVECALAIRDTMKFFNQTKPEYLQADVSIGMGIATGTVFAGTIGSYRKMDYTVIGDTVNIAARLEGLTKKTRFDLIIDQNTRDLLGDKIAVRKMQLNKVRGRTQPMAIYLVDNLVADASGSESEAVIFNH